MFVRSAATAALAIAIVIVATLPMVARIVAVAVGGVVGTSGFIFARGPLVVEFVAMIARRAGGLARVAPGAPLQAAGVNEPGARRDAEIAVVVLVGGGRVA